MPRPKKALKDPAPLAHSPQGRDSGQPPSVPKAGEHKVLWAGPLQLLANTPMPFPGFQGQTSKASPPGGLNSVWPKALGRSGVSQGYHVGTEARNVLEQQ